MHPRYEIVKANTRMGREGWGIKRIGQSDVFGTHGFDDIDSAFQHLMNELGGTIIDIRMQVLLPGGCTFLRFEHTDTFGGEANYTWVKRHIMVVDDTIRDRHIAKLAKAWAGMTGMKGRSEHYNGDTYKFTPYGVHQVLFATVEY